MKRTAQIRLNADMDTLKVLLETVKDAANNVTIDYGTLIVDISTDVYGFDEFISEIEARGLKYRYFETREYSKTELKNAVLFEMWLVNPWEPDPVSAEKYGTKYTNDNVCPKCGRGKIQASELVVDTKKMGKNHIITINPHIIVSELVYNLINLNNFSGCSFAPVHDYKKRQTPNLHQLIISNVLPRMSSEIRTEFWPQNNCEFCGKGGVYLRSEVVYNSSVLSVTEDFNLSTEHFNNNEVQRIIISRRVWEAFKTNKIRAGFEPVRII